MAIFSYCKPPRFIHIIALFICCISSAQEFAESSKWDQLLALDNHKTKLIFSITEECTSCFSMFKYVDYLYQHKRDDVEVYVTIDKQAGGAKVKDLFKKYGYSFRYYYMNDGDNQNDNFDKNPRTYIVDHKKRATEVHYKTSKEHREAILRFVKKDAQKTVREVNNLYANRLNDYYEKIVQNIPEFERIGQEQLDELLEPRKGKMKIVHFNGAWYKTGFVLMLPLMDYLNKHKKENIELSVVLMLNKMRFNQSAEYLTIMLDWAKESGIQLNYYIVDPRELRKNNSSWTGSIPYSYFIFGDGNIHRADGHSEENMNFLLSFVDKEAVKTPKEVRGLYSKEWRETREKINNNGKTYYLAESEKWTLNVKYRDYKSRIWVREGDVIHIKAKGKVRFNDTEYATPNGFTNGAYKELSYIDSENHGALLSVIINKDKKLVQGNVIGENKMFIVKKAGRISLEANDKDYKNNEGTFEGTIKRYVLD